MKYEKKNRTTPCFKHQHISGMNNLPTSRKDCSRFRKRMKLDYYDDDEEDLALVLLYSSASQFEAKKGGGSSVGKSPNLPRGHREGHVRLMQDYFDTNCICPC